MNPLFRIFLNHVRAIGCGALLLVNTCVQGQPAVSSIRILPVFQSQKLELNDKFYPLENGDSIQFETLRFYISDIRFYQKNNLVFREKNSYHLVDASLDSSLIINVNTNEELAFNSVRFYIGIDSTTNMSGALGGDLDPTKGMYWAWQSGYINFKLEGKSNRCKTRNNEFMFHLGGYAAPFNSIQEVSIPIRHTDVIQIALELDSFLSQINLATENSVMIPGAQAMRLSALLVNLFHVRGL